MRTYDVITRNARVITRNARVSVNGGGNILPPTRKDADEGATDLVVSSSLSAGGGYRLRFVFECYSPAWFPK